MKRNFKFNIVKVRDGDIVLEQKVGYYEEIEGVPVGIHRSDDTLFELMPEYTVTELETGFAFPCHDTTIKKTIDLVKAKIIKHKAIFPELINKVRTQLLEKKVTLPVNKPLNS